MKNVTKILCLCIFVGLLSARVSERQEIFTSLNPIGAKSNDSGKKLTCDLILNDDDSVKWKRRHKRRKKARRPKRGR